MISKVRQEYFYTESNIVHEMLYEYTENGKLKRVTQQTTENGVTTYQSVTECTVDEKGNPLKVKVIKDGKVVQESDYINEYDKNGNFIGAEMYQKGALVSRTEYYPDGKARYIEEYRDGALVQTTEMNENGDIVYIWWSNDSETGTETHEYQYDGNGHMKMMITHNTTTYSNGTVEEETYYYRIDCDSEGRKIKSQLITEDGKELGSSDTYEYGANGKMSKQSHYLTGSAIYEITYEYIEIG